MTPGRSCWNLAISIAIGGDCLADIAQVRSETAVFGRVASDPTVSRLIDTLALDEPHALAAINTARAAVRARVWGLAGTDSPDHLISAAAPLTMDLDATLLTAHSEKELAAATFKNSLHQTVSVPSRWFGRPSGPVSRSAWWLCPRCFGMWAGRVGCRLLTRVGRVG